MKRGDTATLDSKAGRRCRGVEHSTLARPSPAPPAGAAELPSRSSFAATKDLTRARGRGWTERNRCCCNNLR
jgi:hypothetical protein